MENAAIIENALLYTLEQGVHTGDFGDKGTPSLIRRPSRSHYQEFRQNAGTYGPALLPNMPVTQTAFKLTSNEMMVTEEMQKEFIVGWTYSS